MPTVVLRRGTAMSAAGGPPPRPRADGLRADGALPWTDDDVSPTPYRRRGSPRPTQPQLLGALERAVGDGEGGNPRVHEEARSHHISRAEHHGVEAFQ